MNTTDTPQQPEQHTYRIGDFVNRHGLTSRGWILDHAQAPDGAIVKVGRVHKGQKLTGEGWRPATFSERHWVELVIGTGVALLALFLVLGLVFGSDSPDGRSAEASDVAFEFVNPSTIKVMWTVTGEPGAEATCRVKAEDESGHYSGSDVAFVDVLETGAHRTWIPLSISDEGAQWVTKVSVSC